MLGNLRRFGSPDTRSSILKLSRNLQKNCGLGAQKIFNLAIRFALTEKRPKLVSPQTVDYLRGIDLALWPGPHFTHNSSNVVEIMGSWIIENFPRCAARTRTFAFAIFRRSGNMVLLKFSNHHLVRSADPHRASVRKW